MCSNKINNNILAIAEVVLSPLTMHSNKNNSNILTITINNQKLIVHFQSYVITFDHAQQQNNSDILTITIDDQKINSSFRLDVMFSPLTMRSNKNNSNILIIAFDEQELMNHY